MAARPAPARLAPVTTAGVAPPTMTFPLAERSTADIAAIPLPNRTPLSVKELAPVPPCCTIKSFVKIKAVEVIAPPTSKFSATCRFSNAVESSLNIIAPTVALT